jgi:hypothetical protein
MSEWILKTGCLKHLCKKVSKTASKLTLEGKPKHFLLNLCLEALTYYNINSEE